jgi:hypothetical protein
MKTSIRALVNPAAILIFSLTTATTVRPQARPMIHDRFASVGGVKLHYLIAGKGDPVILAARLCREQSHVATIDGSTGEDSYGYSAGPVWLRPILQANDRL